MIETRPPLAPGDSAPDFVLPLGYGEGTVSLSEHRGSPVLLALLRGLY